MEITRGRILIQRFFDLADEIDLGRAATLLEQHLPRIQGLRQQRQLRIPRPPLELQLEPRPTGLPDLGPLPVAVRLYDVGAVAVTYTLPLPSPLAAQELVAWSTRLQTEHGAITTAAQLIAAELLARIAPVCKDPDIAAIHEEYVIFAIDATAPAVDAAGLVAALDVPRVLLGEPLAVSEEERGYVSEESYSYDPSNLVVISWDSALTFGEPEGSRVVDLLEVASMQLLELRAYDELVESKLGRIYDEVEEGRVSLFRSAHYKRVARETMRLFIDVSEIAERVDNSLQWLGDSWYARVHRGAVRAFGLRRWEQQLEHKLELLRGINEMLVNQVTSGQAMRLEAAIVLLIVLEIVLAVFEAI